MEKSLRFAKFTYRSLYPFACSEIRSGSTAVPKVDTHGSEAFAAIPPETASLENNEKGNTKSSNSSRNNNTWIFSQDNAQRLQGFERVKQWYRNHYKRVETEPSSNYPSLNEVIQDKKVLKHRAEISSKSKYAINCSAIIEKEKQLLRDTLLRNSRNDTITSSKTNASKEQRQNINKDNKFIPQSKPVLRVLPIEVTRPLAYETKEEIAKNPKPELSKAVKQEPTTDKNILSGISNLNKNSVEMVTIQAIDEVNTIPSWLAHYELYEFYNKFDRLKESERADNKYLKKNKPRKALPKIFAVIRPRPPFRGY
ncbi:uncharacterized protein LOC123295813 [Chrysoperla carnea]|uniref:uncharacterized protein LOC123295813 n=1 Tax=Chrysoperla carnea TaxID=189513 RepID=UPI001D06B255|nr:uncharacterized protein LOC123295813 [Chrysoperla carnea]